MLEVRLLGQFDVRVNGVAAEIPSRPAQSLLAYVLLHASTSHRRERMAGLLWPASDESSARRNLRQALWHVRKALGDAASTYLLTDDISIAFNLEATYWLDVAALDRRIAGDTSAAELMAELSAYGGELLPGFYDDWAVLERERLQAVFDRKMRQLLDRLTAEQRWDETLEWGERWIALGHTPEPAYRALMLAHNGRGDLAQMAAIYRRCVEALLRDLGVEPSEQTRALYERLARGEKVIETGSTAAFRERYRLSDELGRGGLGVVYRARDTLLDRTVAVKLLSPGGLGTEGRARLLREAQSAARLNHTNIVTIYDAGEATLNDDAELSPFIVMELIEGHSLAQYKPHHLNETLNIARQICIALEHAHTHGIIHRDLKPENILITPAGAVKLMDFGLAHSVSAPRLTREDTILGTPVYIAPEIIRGEAIDGRCDLYSFGVILYELTTGRVPFEGNNLGAVFAQHLHAQPRSPASHNPNIAPQLDTLILQLLAKQPADRPASAEAVRQTLDDLIGQPLSMDMTPARGEPPFKGLLHFDESDADLFFGREAWVERLVERLNDGKFLAVVGASGSGKSSLVRAGLAPALKRDDRIDTSIITPTAHPLESLALVLTQHSESVTAAATLMDDLARDRRSLYLFARRQSQPRRVIIVDQFEELFTLCRNETERQAFIDSLLFASGMLDAEDTHAPVSVIITLRADFYAHCARYEALRDVLAHHQEYIGPMRVEELRRAIEEPARRGDWQFEPGLVDLFLRDAGDEPGALPLLSHALLETWQRRRTRTLTLAGYAESGGVHGAIARSAERVYQALHPSAQKIARNIFLRLTEPGEGTQDTRRRATLDELVPQTEDASMVADVLRTLADARLITTAENSAEVAHEALIREWPTLRAWLDEDREGLRLHRHLTESAQEWEALNREPGELYQGARLAQALEWTAAHPDRLNPLEREFLVSAQAEVERRESEREAQRQRELIAAQRLAQTEAQRAREQSAATRRLRQRAILLGVALVVAAILALMAIESGRQAIQNAQQAEREARIALARELASAAINNQNVDAELSVLLALEAVDTTYRIDKSVLREAQNALHQTLPNLRVLRRLLPHTASVNEIALSPDGRFLATASNDMTAKIIDLSSGEEVRTLRGHSDWLWTLTFSVDGRWLATASRDGTARIWDATTGESLLTLPQHDAEVLGISFSPDGRWLATGDGNGQQRLWEISEVDGQLSADLRQSFTNTGGAYLNVFSPDGRFLAIDASLVGDGEIHIWRMADLPLDGSTINETTSALILCCHPELVELDYSADGTRLVSGSNDATTKIWDANSGRELLTLYDHSGPINGAAFNSDGTQLVTSSGDGSARIWSVPPGATGAQLLLTLSGQLGSVIEAYFLPDGHSLVSASEGGSVTVWDINPSRELLTLTGHDDWIWDATFSPDGRRLATAGFDLTAIVWDVTNGEEIFRLPQEAHSDWINRAVFSSDGRLLATASNDATAKVWDIASGEELLTLTGHEYRVDGFPYQGVGHVLFGPNDAFLLTSGGDGSVRLWDANTGQERWSLQAHEEVVTSLALNRDGTRLATVGFDARAHVWDISDPSQPAQLLFTIELPGQERGTWGAAFSADGTRLAITERDGQVSIWDAATDGDHTQPLHTLIGHTSIVPGAAFSLDGARLATASFDGTTRIWDVKSGAELLTLSGHQGGVTGVTFSPDGSRLVTTSQDGTARVYVLSIEELLALARSRLMRTWTEQECNRYLHLTQCAATEVALPRVVRR